MEWDVPDTTKNRAPFGSSGGDQAAFPKILVVTVTECGSHAPVLAAMGAGGGQGQRGAVWTPTGFVDTIRSGTMVYEERTGSGTGSQEVHPGI